MHVAARQWRGAGGGRFRFFGDESFDRVQIAFDDRQIVLPVAAVASLAAAEDQVVGVLAVGCCGQGGPFVAGLSQELADGGQAMAFSGLAIERQVGGGQQAAGVVLSQMGEQGEVETGVAQFRIWCSLVVGGQDAARLLGQQAQVMGDVGRGPLAAEPVLQGVFHVLVDAVELGRVTRFDLCVFFQARAGVALGPEGPQAGRKLERGGEQGQDLAAGVVQLFRGIGGFAEAVAQFALSDWMVASARPLARRSRRMGRWQAAMARNCGS